MFEFYITYQFLCLSAPMVELADTGDLSSSIRRDVPVQVRVGVSVQIVEWNRRYTKDVRQA